MYEELVLPGWGSPDRHGFPRTLYGYVLEAFSFVDLLSQYRTALEPRPAGQTPRMENFAADYLGASAAAAAVSVKMWRHTLVHTAGPRVLEDPGTGRRIRWLLHWRDHLPRSQHLTFADSGTDLILNLGFLYLAEDLSAASASLFDQLGASGDARREAVALHQKLDCGRVRLAEETPTFSDDAGGRLPQAHS